MGRLFILLFSAILCFPFALPVHAETSEADAAIEQVMIETKTVRAPEAALARLGIDPRAAAADWNKLAASPEVETLAGGSIVAMSGNEAQLDATIRAYFPTEWKVCHVNATASAQNMRNIGILLEEVPPAPRFGDPINLGYVLHGTPQICFPGPVIHMKLQPEYFGLDEISQTAGQYFMPVVQAWRQEAEIEAYDGVTACLQRRMSATTGGGREWLFTLATTKRIPIVIPKTEHQPEAGSEEVEVLWQAVEIPRAALLALARANGFTERDALGNAGLLPDRLAELVRNSPKSRLVFWWSSRAGSGNEAAALDVCKQYFPTEWEPARDVTLPGHKPVHTAAAPRFGDPAVLGMNLRFIPQVRDGKIIHLKLTPEWSVLDGWRSPDGTVSTGDAIPSTEKYWMGDIAKLRTETEVEIADGQTLQIARLQGRKAAATAAVSFFGTDNILKPGAKLGPERDLFVFVTARRVTAAAVSAGPGNPDCVTGETDLPLAVESKIVRVSAAALAKLGIDPATAVAGWEKLATAPEAETLAGGSIVALSGNETLLDAGTRAYFPTEWEKPHVCTLSASAASQEVTWDGTYSRDVPSPRFGDPAPLGYTMRATVIVRGNGICHLKICPQYAGLDGLAAPFPPFAMPRLRSWQAETEIELTEGAAGCIQRRQFATADGGREWLVHLVAIRRLDRNGQPLAAAHKKSPQPARGNNRNHAKAVPNADITCLLVEIPRKALLDLAQANGFTAADALGNGGVLPARLAELMRNSPAAKHQASLSGRAPCGNETTIEETSRHRFPVEWEGTTELFCLDGKHQLIPAAPRFGDPTELGTNVQVTPALWDDGRGLHLKIAAVRQLLDGWRSYGSGQVVYTEQAPPGIFMPDLAIFNAETEFNLADGATVQVARVQGKKRADSAGSSFFGPDDILKHGARLGEERDLFLFVTARLVNPDGTAYRKPE